MGTRDEEKRYEPWNLLSNARQRNSPGAVMATADVFPLCIHLFGPFEACLHGQPLPRLRSRKGQWLLALLVLRHGREVERAWLAGTLWPDSSEAAAFASLRISLKDLRRALGPEAGRLRSPTPRALALDLEGAHADVVAFDAAVAQGEVAALERAVALYRGPLLEGCAEEWAFQERQVREQAYLQALETLAAQAMEQVDLGAAERHLQRAVAVEPLRESAQRALMQALAAGGNYAAATQVYRELRLRLHRELNAAPDPETQALYQQLREEAQGRADGATGGRGDGKASKITSKSKSKTGPARTLTPTLTLTRPLSDRPLVPSLPTGTVTFLFTDIEGSSQLWERHPAAMKTALEQHDLLLRQSIQAHGGLVFKTVGDAFYAAFATAPAAVAAALAAQRGMQIERWGETGPLRVRMALHTGIAEAREGDYFGPTLNRVARLLDAGHGGQVLLSLPTEELVRDELPEGTSLRPLGEHRLKDLVRSEQVFQLLHPDLPASFPPLRSLAAFTHNLPLQWSSFVGREKEMEEVKRLLPTTPLLTLTGAGGCGKTRLALQAAADLLEVYPDGVWLVELAALSDPALVPQIVAVTLGVREGPERSLTEALADYLRPRSPLLLLDNCEHLLSACAHLADGLLRACPNLRILATSREALNLSGEQVYRVPSLSLPDPGQDPCLERLQESEAVRLFVDRALANQHGFALTGANASAVAEVCRRLDGIPLAIELAAARVKALPVEKLAERLDGMFRLLTGGSRAALPRQQTLQALIDWSYNLLSPSEQMLLRRLSVFAGGWTLEAAEAVCPDDERPTTNDERLLYPDVGRSSLVVRRDEVLDHLSSLVEKSLVQYDEGQGNEARYRLLEAVRQYARDRLLEAGEGLVVRERHLEFFLRLAEEAAPHLDGSEPGVWLSRLEMEHDNLRAALTWSQAEPGAGETGLRLAGALARLWDLHGYWREGSKWLAEALAHPGAAGSTRARSAALRGAGNLAAQLADREATRTLLEESLAIAREVGDKQIMARTLATLAFRIADQGDSETACALGEESLALYRGLEDDAGIAVALNALGIAARLQDELATACAQWEESLAISRKLGRRNDEAATLCNLGLLAIDQGDWTRARMLLEGAYAIDQDLGRRGGLAIRSLGWVALWQCDYAEAERSFTEEVRTMREVGNQPRLSLALVALGCVACYQGKLEEARSLFRESLKLAIQRGLQREIAPVLEGFARVAGAQAQAERAARLFGAAAALREATSTPVPRSWRADHEQQVAAVRADLGEEAFATAWAEGRAMTLQQAVTYAHEESDADTPTQ